MDSINPHYKKQDFKDYSIEHCLERIGKDKEILSFLISKAESSRLEDISFVSDVLRNSNDTSYTRRIAITGAPGVGKSTLINSFTAYLSNSTKKKIAILPIDPSSKLSKGSLLGDRTRMIDLIGHGENVFIKPTASSLALGGIAPSTKVAIDLCEMAGYEMVIIETVGVGQSEYEVRDLVDLMILLQQPGGGDELQGIKRGIMELADIIVVNKADGDLEDAATRSQKDHQVAVQYINNNQEFWKLSVMTYSSMKPDSPKFLSDKIDACFNAHTSKAQLRSAQNEKYFKNLAEKLLVRSLMADVKIKEQFERLIKEVGSGTLNPTVALVELGEKCDLL